MNQIYTLLLCLLYGFSLSAQNYDFPCDAEADPVDGWGTSTTSQLLSGDFTGVSPWVTDIAGGAIQDFGIDGADSSLFYKLEMDLNTSYIRIEYLGGTANNVNLGLFSLFSTECGGGTNYGESLYQDPEMNDILVEALMEEGEIMFSLCDFVPSNFNNLYLWLAVSEGDVGDFQIEVTQMVSPYNNECNDVPGRGAGDLGVLEANDQVGDCMPLTGWITQTNEAACVADFDFNTSPCFEGHEVEPTVWYAFETGSDVASIDLTVEHFVSENLRVSLFEMENQCMSGDILFPPFQNAEDYCNSGSGLIEFEDLDIEPNTSYFIAVSTPMDEWGEFEICISGNEIVNCTSDPLPQRCLCETEPICSMDTLSDYCMEMEFFQTPWSVFPACPGNVLNNPAWISFVAGEDPISLLLTSSDCQLIGGSIGIQLGIYYSEETDFPPDPDCTTCNPNLQNLIPVFTHCGCSTDPIFANFTPEPGRRYFIVIDGCAGSFCQVDIEVLQGSDPPGIGPLEINDFEEIQLVEFDGVDTFCRGATGVTLDIETPVGAGILEYQVLPGSDLESVIVDGSGDIATIDIPDSIFINEGSFELCARAFNECGSSTDEICKTYYVMELPNRFDDSLILCKNETAMWEGIEVPDSSQALGTTQTYDVELYNDSYGCPFTAFIEVTRLEGSMPIPNFDQEVDSLNVEFFNLTEDAVSYIWVFGDGNTSTAENPIQNYEEAGIYNVSLTAINDCDTVTLEREIAVGGFPVANFDQTGPSMGCAPLEIQFENASNGEIDSILWIFDGGTPATSTEENPVVTYNAPGMYDVTLIVGNAAGTNQFTKQKLVSVNILPDAEISSRKVDELTYDFTSEFGDTTHADFRWEFGDGNESTEPNPEHTYAEAGMYEVLFIWWNDCGVDTLSLEVDIISSSLADMQLSSIQMFPNPTTGQVILERVPPGAQVSIHDVNGRLMHSIDHMESARKRLRLTNFTSGVYVVRITYDGVIERRKLVVK